MKREILPALKLLSLAGAVLLAHAAWSQNLPRNTFGFRMPAQPSSIPMPRNETTAPGFMLHRWPHATASAGDSKSLGEMLAQHPELQTHSHMTYFSSSLRVGERTRLQPPGSEFSH